MLDIEYSRGRCDIRFRFVLFGGILRDWLLLPSLGGGRRFSRYGRHTFARLLFAQSTTLHILALVRHASIGWCRHGGRWAESIQEMPKQQRSTANL
jgi:hypothetical protein